MATNTLDASPPSLGGFLRDRRARLQPAPGVVGRRRTPGLRREEVAARAGVSVTWYTWLEQGRGGPPSDDVLERLASALELDTDGREVLFLLAHHRPPPIKATSPSAVAPALQRVLDGFGATPAIVKTAAWDVVAWNAAATAVLADYAAIPSSARNVLRRLFASPNARASLPDWESDARFALAAFRVDVARGGDFPEAAALAAELHETSADFRRMWADGDMRTIASARKRIEHPVAGTLNLEYSSFSVDGAHGLTMIVFTPASSEDARAIATLV